MNIDKPAGMSSHDLVVEVRRISGEKRVGHAGTLDPMATGVLVICLGQATRVVEYLMKGRKIYRARIRLGVSTDTYDTEGNVTHSVPTVDVSLSEIEQALSSFSGQVEQLPPMYSALKYKGTPLYKLARRGLTVERKRRLVEIEEIQVLDWSSPFLTIQVTCSPGTYIRSLAHDLGERLGCGGHLHGLVRLACGRFTLAEAVTLEALAEAFAQNRWSELIRPIDEALLMYEAMTVNAEVEHRIRLGQQVKGPRPLSPSSLRRAYSAQGHLIALLRYDARTGRWQPEKVFASE
ncbi:MAG: tRNA pseudouridine(55) synthase TruB [Anaerolineae bacterium]